MKPLVVSSNMLNEAHQLPEWFEFVTKIADGGIVIVDGGSTDGSLEIYEKWRERYTKLAVVSDDIIQREGYGPARNHLRACTRHFFPNAHWMIYLDGDERILEEDFHTLRFLKDNLDPKYDIIALARIDWYDKEMTKAAKDVNVHQDWQARMSRLNSPLTYLRKLHEQVQNFSGIYSDLTGPKIHHFHRSTSQEVRDFVGKLCAKLHMEDTEFGHTMPEHHKEAMYRERYLKEGL